MDFLQKALIGYGELLMTRRKTPFSCGRCGNEAQFIWMTQSGKPTTIPTTFARVTFGQHGSIPPKRSRHPENLATAVL